MSATEKQASNNLIGSGAATQARTVLIPMDFTSLPEFNMLVAYLMEGGIEPDSNRARFLAGHIYVSLWQQMAFYSTISPLGCIDASEMTYVMQRIMMGSDQATAEKVVDMVVRARVLSKDKDYYFCHKFYWVNFHLEERFRPNWMKSAEGKWFYSRKAKMMKKSMELDLPDHWFVVDGIKPAPEQRNRAITIIRMIDSIVGLRSREPRDFTQGMIADAMRFVHRYSAEYIDLILRKLLAKRMSPEIPRACETILSREGLQCVLHVLDLPEEKNYVRMAEPAEPNNPAAKKA